MRYAMQCAIPKDSKESNKGEWKMTSTLYLVSEMLADFTDEEIAKECDDHDIPICMGASRQEMILQIVQFAKVEQGE